MLIITIKTDNPQAELALYEDQKQLTSLSWLAGRQLAETIHGQINGLLEQAGKSLENLDGVICFAGPGSFTGLRIGLTVGNALANSYKLPIVAEETENWTEKAIAKLLAGHGQQVVVPKYGGVVHVSQPKK